MRALALKLAQALVARPDRVRVSEEPEPGAVLLEISVAAEDRGRVIGRRGRTAEALRTVLSAVAHRRGTRCVVEILD